MPKTLSSPLCSQNVSFQVKIEGGFDENKLEKSSIEKTLVFKKKTKFGYSVLGLRKPNFKTKIIHFEISHNAENCGRGPFEIFNKHYVAKFQKKEGEPLESLKKFRKKISNSLIVPKNLKEGALWDFSTFVLLQNVKN